jgi:hypothetical protein
MKKLFGIIALMVVMTFAFSNVNAQIFLGKGDVQTVLGLNNAKMNADAPSLVFTYETVNSYSITVEWTTETGGKESKIIEHAIDLHRNTVVSTTVAADARKNANSPIQVTGFWLTFGATTVSGGEIPVVNIPASLYENLGGNNLGNDAVVTAVTLESSTGGLYVGSVLIPTFVL